MIRKVSDFAINCVLIGANIRNFLNFQEKMKVFLCHNYNYAFQRLLLTRFFSHNLKRDKY